MQELKIESYYSKGADLWLTNCPDCYEQTIITHGSLKAYVLIQSVVVVTL
jgi:hypothetical protein